LLFLQDVRKEKANASALAAAADKSKSVGIFSGNNNLAISHWKTQVRLCFA
jgi:hypothetical protein